MTVRPDDSDPEELVFQVGFPDTPPGTLHSYWTEPELLQGWWAPEAEIEPMEGGSYHLTFPDGDWHLRGKYTAFHPGRELAFTWTWDHEPEHVRQVHIAFESEGERGSRLTLTHGRYGPGDEEERQSHIDGWSHFLPRLEEYAGNEAKQTS